VEPAAPIIPSSGTIRSADLVRMFAETCVRPFPDERSVQRAFAADGFDIGRDGAMRREADGLWAALGPYAVLLEPLPGGRGGALPEGGVMCQVSGHVSDPEAFPVAIESVVDATGQPLEWETLGSFRATFMRDGVPLSLEAEPPVLATVAKDDWAENLRIMADDCGDLPECRIWGVARLRVFAPDSLITRLQAAIP
jgi:hypothetical protein